MQGDIESRDLSFPNELSSRTQQYCCFFCTCLFVSSGVLWQQMVNQRRTALHPHLHGNSVNRQRCKRGLRRKRTQCEKRKLSTEQNWYWSWIQIMSQEKEKKRKKKWWIIQCFPLVWLQPSTRAEKNITMSKWKCTTWKDFMLLHLNSCWSQWIYDLWFSKFWFTYFTSTRLTFTWKICLQLLRTKRMESSPTHY